MRHLLIISLLLLSSPVIGQSTGKLTYLVEWKDGRKNVLGTQTSPDGRKYVEEILLRSK